MFSGWLAGAAFGLVEEAIYHHEAQAASGDQSVGQAGGVSPQLEVLVSDGCRACSSAIAHGKPLIVHVHGCIVRRFATENTGLFCPRRQVLHATYPCKHWSSKPD